MKRAYCTECGKALGETNKTKCDDCRGADRKEYQRKHHKVRSVATAALIAEHRDEFKQIFKRTYRGLLTVERTAPKHPPTIPDTPR